MKENENKNIALSNTLTTELWNPEQKMQLNCAWTLNHRNCEIINGYCFMLIIIYMYYIYIYMYTHTHTTPSSLADIMAFLY